MNKIWKPHNYQRTAMSFLLSNPCSGLFLDPGLGKTSVSLASIKILKYAEHIKGVLMIAPLRVIYSVWPGEISKWNNFNNLDYTILHDDNKDSIWGGEKDLYLINPEGLEWLHRELLIGLKSGKKCPFNSLWIDESTKFKSHKSNRFKLIKDMIPLFKRRHIMTGTPAPKGLLDLWSQIYILDEGKTLGTNYYKFRRKYFQVDDWNEHNWYLKEGSADEIHKLISPIVLEMSAKDYLDMPDQLFNDINIELPGKIMSAYKQMERKFFIELDNSKVSAESTAQASIKCHQISNGNVYEDIPEGLNEDEIRKFKRTRKSLFVHKAKLEALKDLTEELNGKPLLVAYHYKHDLQALKKLLGRDTPHIGSGVSPKEAKVIEAKWNAGELPVLLGHPACLHPSTEVLTERRGWVKIINVSNDDRVFDGVEFVKHEGCSYSGYKEVIDVFGITMTHKHKLLIDNNWVEASYVRDTEEIKRKALYQYKGNDSSISKMFKMSESAKDNSPKRYKTQQVTEAVLPILCSRSIPQYDRYTYLSYLARDETSSLQPIRQKLRWPWHIDVHRVAGLQRILCGYGWNLFGRFNYRKDRCKQTLLQKQLYVDFHVQSAGEQKNKSDCYLSRGADTFSRASTSIRFWQNNAFNQVESRDDRRRSCIRRKEVNVRKKHETCKYEASNIKKEHVYDLVNCGPRHRFLIRNSRGEVFVSHNSMAHGLNLQASGNDICWFSLTWNLEEYLQFNARIYRQGVKGTVRIHHLVSKRTIDEAMILRLGKRAKEQEDLREALKKYRRSI